jgi:hypothetical protein
VSLNSTTVSKLNEFKDALTKNNAHLLLAYEKIIQNREKISLDSRISHLDLSSLSAIYILEVYNSKDKTITVYERYYHKDENQSKELPLEKKALLDGKKDSWWYSDEDPIGSTALSKIKTRFKNLNTIDYSLNIVRKEIETSGCGTGLPSGYYKQLERKERRKLNTKSNPKTYSIETLIVENEVKISFQKSKNLKPKIVIWIHPF